MKLEQLKTFPLVAAQIHFIFLAELQYLVTRFVTFTAWGNYLLLKLSTQSLLPLVRSLKIVKT